MSVQKFSLAVFLVSIGFSNLYADGRDAFSFLLIAPTPRAASLGESFVAVCEGPETIFFNPAGLAFENKKHFYVQSLILPFVEGVKLNNLVYVHPLSQGAWGVQSGILHVGGFVRTISDASSADGYQETGSFSTYDFHMGGSFGRKFGKNFGVGALFRFLRESLSDASANGFSFDLGLLYRDEVLPASAGMAIQNIGPKVKFQDESQNLPSIFRGGAALRQPKESPVPFVPLDSMVSAELVKPLRGEASIRGGFEIPFLEQLLFRTGYNYSLRNQQLGSTLSLPNGLTFGIGIKMNLWQLDYALASLGEMGLTHRIALDLRWDSP